MKTKDKIAGYIRSGVLVVLLFAALVALVSAFDIRTSPSSSLKSAASSSRTSTNLGDVAVDVDNHSIKKLSAVDGIVLWSVAVANDSALAVDPIDLGVYTGYGNHDYTGRGTIYKYGANGSLVWTNSISVSGFCNFYYVNGAAVDVTSASPGVVWTQTGCYGGIAKTSRRAGNQRWSVFTDDVGTASIDPITGRIYAVTNAGPQYNYDTIYSVGPTGTHVGSTSSCEGYTDLNPADGMLYRGGDTRSSGCGLTLSQLNKTDLAEPNWSMDLSGQIRSFDALAVQPWNGGHVYVASGSSSKIVVINPATRSVIRTFITTVAPNHIAVNPVNRNVYVSDGSSHFVYAYRPTGALAWISPDLGGPVINIAAPRSVAPNSTPTPTPSVTPCAAPAVTTGVAISIGNSAATLNGTVNAHGCTTTVHFEYGTTAGYGSVTANETVTGNATRNLGANVRGLSADTTYHFRVIGHNGTGTSRGADRVFTTR